MNKKNIKLLFMDVDGTLTDGKIYMGNDGEIFKAFSIKDGYGIAHILKEADIIPVIITARESEIVKRRCKELGIDLCIQNCPNKKEKMIEICGEYGIVSDKNGKFPQTAYIGDDLMDLECMKISEFCGCPGDAVKEIKAISDFISPHDGGDGAVRAFIEWFLYE